MACHVPAVPTNGPRHVGEPAQHVVHGGNDAAGCADRHPEETPVVTPVRALDVQRSAVGQAIRIQGPRHRVVHAEGIEDAPLQELAPLHPADALDHLGQQRVAAVGVAPVLARREIGAVQAGEQLQLGSVRHGQRLAHGAVEERLDVKRAPHAGEVAHDLGQRHPVRPLRQFREVAAQAVLRRQLAVLGQEHDAQCTEVLRGGPDAHTDRRRQHHGQLDAREAEAAPVNWDPVMGDADGEARGARRCERREEFVQLRRVERDLGRHGRFLRIAPGWPVTGARGGGTARHDVLIDVLIGEFNAVDILSGIVCPHGIVKFTGARCHPQRTVRSPTGPLWPPLHRSTHSGQARMASGHDSGVRSAGERA